MNLEIGKGLYRMSDTTVRTRYAPSPTGFMHVGNLRTALYEYLIAKSMGGSFILRIEDTDQERQVEGAVDVIYNTLATVGLKHDEGPDVGGPYGPYIQSERKEGYRPYAEQLVREGKAYYCFCTRERLDGLHEAAAKERLCRRLRPPLPRPARRRGRAAVAGGNALRHPPKDAADRLHHL